MQDLMKSKRIPDYDVVFYDGFLTIIYKSWFLKRLKVERIMLDPEYTEAITLADIAKRYPTVTMVVYENWLHGSVFKYKNHRENDDWELVGTTVGFA